MRFVVLLVGILMFSIVDLRRGFVFLSTDTVNFRYGAQGVLDEGAVAQVEFQVGCFVCHGLPHFTARNHCHGRCRQIVRHLLNEN